jgi:hypothetical protein
MGIAWLFCNLLGFYVVLEERGGERSDSAISSLSQKGGTQEARNRGKEGRQKNLKFKLNYIPITLYTDKHMQCRRNQSN